MNLETIVITAVVGSLAGWLIGLVMKRSGYELIVDTASVWRAASWAALPCGCRKSCQPTAGFR